MAFLPFSRPVVLQLRSGFRFRVRSLMDAWIVKETCLDRQYLSTARVQDGWTVIDVGAGIGDFAILMAREHPHSRIYAYEPFPPSYALLQQNIALNGVGNVTPFPAAVGAVRGTARLFLEGDAVQHSVSKRSVNATAPFVEVQTLTLMDVHEQNGIERCDVLKMDCEGCEFDVLLNASAEVLQRITQI